MAAERSVAVIKVNGKLAISNGKRQIVKTKATQVIYCRRLDLDHPETLMFNRCVLTSWFWFGCRLQNGFLFGFFFFKKFIVYEQMRTFPHLLWAVYELLVVGVATLHAVTGPCCTTAVA